MKKIELTQGEFALVDDEDFEELNKHKWHAHKEGGIFYAVRRVPCSSKGSKVRMHRQIMRVSYGIILDHIDGNGLNNQKSNLRICTTSQNQMNSSKRKDNTSGFKGVRWHKKTKKWEARIWVNNKWKYLGHHVTPEVAACAYNEAAKKYYGEFANLNPVAISALEGVKGEK
jgi:hypothetical protein